MSVRIGSTKLANSIVERMMKDNLTPTEIDLLLYLALRQDVFGKVDGIYFKDVCLELGIVKQTFYNALYGLSLKEYIRIVDLKADYWNVVILNNVFRTEQDDRKGYVNINKDFLFSWEFKRLKANEKKLCLKLLSIYKPEHGLQVYPETIAAWLGIKSKSMAVIYSYCDSIMRFFPNTRIDGKKGNLVLFYKHTYHDTTYRNMTEREHFFTHKITHICRVYRICYTIKDLKDLIILLVQYAKKGIGKICSIISDVLIKKRCIEPRLINFLLSSREENEQATFPDPDTPLIFRQALGVYNLGFMPDTT